MPEGRNLVLLLIFLLLLGVILWLLLGSRRKPVANGSGGRDGASGPQHAGSFGSSDAAAPPAAGAAGAVSAGTMGAAAWGAARGEDVNESADALAAEAVAFETEDGVATAGSFDAGADGALRESRLADDEAEAAEAVALADAQAGLDGDYALPDLSGDVDDFDLPADGGLPGLAHGAAEVAHVDVAEDVEVAAAEVDVVGEVAQVDVADVDVAANSGAAVDLEVDATGLDSDLSSQAHAEIDAAGLDNEVSVSAVDAFGVDGEQVDDGPYLDAAGLDAVADGDLDAMAVRAGLADVVVDEVTSDDVVVDEVTIDNAVTDTVDSADVEAVQTEVVEAVGDESVDVETETVTAGAVESFDPEALDAVEDTWTDAESDMAGGSVGLASATTWTADGSQDPAADAASAGGHPAYGSADDSADDSGDDGADPVVVHEHAIVDGGWSVGSAAPIADGCMPLGHPIKGVFVLGIYQVPGSDWYADTVADVWFSVEGAAQNAGFRRGEG